MSATPPRVAVIQDGARLNYAVPLALQQAGALERAFVEWAAPPGSPERLAARAIGVVAPALGRRLRDRWRDGLDPARVSHNSYLALQLRLMRRGYATQEAYWEAYSRRVAGWVRGRGWGRANALFGFVRNIDPELCRSARDAGLATIGDQIIAPAVTEMAQFEKELARWPGWHPGEEARDLSRVDRVERATWGELDQITCGSDYVRGELAARGVDPARVAVLPYPVPTRPPARPPATAREASGLLTVGFVGGVGVRKGAGYFAGVARRLGGRGRRFVMVGPVQLGPAGDRALRDAGVELVGPVPRSGVATWLGRFDVFLFPSTCEGSASAVMEALASRLPVVCSPESGSVVTDGADGFIRSYDDEAGMAKAVGRLLGDPALRKTLGAAAAAAAGRFDHDRYREQLVGVCRAAVARRHSIER